MKQNLIFASVLLIVLSVCCSAIPLHKRVTTFQGCPPNGTETYDALPVTVTPDPIVAGQPVTFNIVNYNSTQTIPEIPVLPLYSLMLVILIARSS